jgi:hypothetical protein
MSERWQLSADERRHFLRRAALAPLCLCLVAGLHVVRVWAARQTPWKGGGFGMFSTVDSEANRFLRTYLITDSGELPLSLPPALDKRAAEQRAAPSKAGLREIASRVAAQNWRPGGKCGELEPVPLAEHSADAVAFRAVRVECWRLRFDARGEQLRAERMVEATADRAEARP